MVLLCGRYEGIDERLLETEVDIDVSIGDYVLSGGELAAMVLIDAVVRLLPGALNDGGSAEQDSFAEGLLDCPHYTRPEDYRGLPVPAVPYASENEHWFGVPYLVMERMAGRVYLVWDPHESFARTPAVSHPLWQQCVDALVGIHRFDWRTHLSTWQEPEPLREQVERWQKIYLHSPEPQWIEQARVVEQLLLETLPDGMPVGIFHGDYQPGNILYEDGRLTGVIDWELSGIGAQLLDIGWLLMVADPANWVDEWHPVHPLPLAEIRSRYEAGMGQRFDAIPWYQAFAGYRLASIGCLNVKLHRKGQRHDPLWEKMALCLSSMFERARELLVDYAAR